MTPQQLRNSILQMAIEGKLTEQRAEDGNAADLLKEIKTEKAKLIAEKKIKKEKPLPEISEDEIPFEIPDNWIWTRWGEIAKKIQYGFNAPAKDNGFCRMVRISDIQNNKVIWDSVPFCDISADDAEEYYLQENDILFARTGGTVGKSFLVTTVPYQSVYAGYLIRTQYSELLEPLYLKLFMESDLYWQQLKNGTIATAQPNCNGKTLSKMMIPLPPLAEQKRIVARLEEILPQIDEYEKAYNELQELNKKFPDNLKNSLLQMAIEGKLVEQRAEDGNARDLLKEIKAEKARLIKEKKIKKEKPLPEISEDEIPFEIPDNWTVGRFVDFGVYRKGPFGSALTKSIFVPKGENTVKVYEQKNAIQKNIDIGDYYIPEKYFLDKMQSFEVKAGDVIVSCAGTIGETFIIPEKFEKGIINQALMRMSLMPSVYVPYFLLYFDVILKENAKRSSKGSAIKNIPPFEELKAYVIPLPPLAEQKRIVAKLEHLLPLCDALQETSYEKSSVD